MESHYDNHRFDNPSAWLDRVERAKARAEGRHQGFGFAIPKEHIEPRPQKPFYAQEYSFTSGLLVNRKYYQFDSQRPTEGTRADPWHYPNAMKTQDADHYKSHKRRSQNCDPRFWQPDPVLSGKISEEAVQKKVAAERDEIVGQVDPRRMEQLFAENVRPNAKTLHELNVDLSCVSLPAREGGSTPSSRVPFGRPSLPSGLGSSTPSESARGGGLEEDLTPAAGQGPGVAGLLDKEGEKKWNWCMRGRPDVVLGQPTMRDMHLTKTRSLPTMLGGISTLSGSIGGPPSPFHGMPTRKFGMAGRWDGRMRGGQLAREGWAGTFPSREIRPM